MLVSARNGWMFDGLASTAIMENLEVLALVQECQDTHSAPIVQRLLLNTEGANPDTVTPTRTVGWTWSDFVVAAMRASGETGVRVNPLALVKADEEPIVAPAPDEVIASGDSVSMSAFPGFDWGRFEAAMVKSRAPQRSG